MKRVADTIIGGDTKRVETELEVSLAELARLARLVAELAEELDAELARKERLMAELARRKQRVAELELARRERLDCERCKRYYELVNENLHDEAVEYEGCGCGYVE